jgi:2-polyprenyl-6-methoxyphenol hydroxylase-like FAD-dependent oxidoreductase
MLEALPANIVFAGHKFVRFETDNDVVTVHFDNGAQWEADLLIGADGIRSAVAQQVFGDAGLFHCGIQVWLGWCYCDSVPRDIGYLSHSPTVQASFFPLLHEGREAFEWWLVEPWNKGQPFRGDVKTHIMRHLEGWTEPLPTLVRATDFERNTFRWEIYNRRPLRQWSHGRVSFLGDAVHPVSPYAAYGMGMAIEDGYYLARSLAGADLADRDLLAAALAKYEAQRVDYTNKQAIFARYLGYVFHRLPWPLRTIRDAVFDHTRFLERMLVKNYLRDAEAQMLALDL